MDFYTEPPEWRAEGEAPPQHKRNEGWNPEERVPASWLNWFFHRTYESLREIAQAFIYHRDASAPHDGHETKEGANAKVKAHSDQKSGVHGVGPNEYLAKTSRSDQRVGWDDIVDKPSQFPAPPHNHDDRYYTKSQSDSRYAPIHHSHGAADLPKASTSQQGIVQLTTARTSTSSTLALAASAMNSHITSADHDVRYPTRSEVNSAIDQLASLIGSGVMLATPSDDILAQSLSEQNITDLSTNVKRFRVWIMGRYRVTIEAKEGTIQPPRTHYLALNVRRERGGDVEQISEVIVAGTSSYSSFTFTTPVLYPGDELFFSLRSTGGPTGEARASVRNARLRGRVEAAPAPEVLN